MLVLDRPGRDAGFSVFRFCVGLWLAMGFLSEQAVAVTIDFDALTAGTAVDTVGEVTFSVVPDVGLEVGTGLTTTSGANYLAATQGDGSFLSGDVIRLDFAAPVRSLSLAIISTMGTAPGAFTLFTGMQSSTNAAPDAFLGMDEVYLLSVDPGVSCQQAELRAAAGGLFAFNLDDVIYAVPEPVAPLAWVALAFSASSWRRRMRRSWAPSTGQRRLEMIFLLRSGFSVLALVLLGDAALAQRAVPVNVVNQPAVLAVENVHEPAFQPASLQNTRFSSHGPNTTTLFTGVKVNPVPVGKRLVVQHVSYSMSSAALIGDPDCRIRVGFSPETHVHPVPVRRAFQGNGREIGGFSIPITMYVDAGQEVEVVCSVQVADSVSQRIGVSGFYVDVP